jgi:hypothetical protein
MLRAALVTSLALSGPVALAPWIEPVLRQGEQAGELLGQLAVERAAPPEALPLPVTETAETPLTDEELETELARETSKPARKSKGTTKRSAGSRSALPTPKRGLRVSQARVLGLARTGVIPTSRFVAATATRPAGLELAGVSGLGIGMREGDVLTHVAGVPVSERGQVVNLVLQARARRAAQISARFSRDGEPWMLVVDLPYPEAKPSRATSDVDR